MPEVIRDTIVCIFPIVDFLLIVMMFLLKRAADRREREWTELALNANSLNTRDLQALKKDMKSLKDEFELDIIPGETPSDAAKRLRSVSRVIDQRAEYLEKKSGSSSGSIPVIPRS